MPVSSITCELSWWWATSSCPWLGDVGGCSAGGQAKPAYVRTGSEGTLMYKVRVLAEDFRFHLLPIRFKESVCITDC